MEATAISPGPGTAGFAAATPTADLLDRQHSFAAVLAQHSDTGADPQQRARIAAERFVAATLINPVLKGLRDSSMAAAPFAPGFAERQMRSLLDADLSHRIARAGGFPLVDRLAMDLLQRMTIGGEHGAG